MYMEICMRDVSIDSHSAAVVGPSETIVTFQFCGAVICFGSRNKVNTPQNHPMRNDIYTHIQHTEERLWTRHIGQKATSAPRKTHIQRRFKLNPKVITVCDQYTRHERLLPHEGRLYALEKTDHYDRRCHNSFAQRVAAHIFNRNHIYTIPALILLWCVHHAKGEGRTLYVRSGCTPKYGYTRVRNKLKLLGFIVKLGRFRRFCVGVRNALRPVRYCGHPLGGRVLELRGAPQSYIYSWMRFGDIAYFSGEMRSRVFFSSNKRRTHSNQLYAIINGYVVRDEERVRYVCWFTQRVQLQGWCIHSSVISYSAIDSIRGDGPPTFLIHTSICILYICRIHMCYKMNFWKIIEN